MISNFIRSSYSFGPEVISGSKLIVKKYYTPFTDSGVVELEAGFGGGNVQVSSSTIMSNNPAWGAHNLFDGEWDYHDWVTNGSPGLMNGNAFLKLNFPRKIEFGGFIIIPRQQGDELPNNVNVYVDGSLVSSVSGKAAISSDDGLNFKTNYGTDYVGIGLKVPLENVGYELMIEFPDFYGSYVAVGEIELFGFPA